MVFVWLFVCLFAANNSSVIRGHNVALGTPVHLQRLLGVLRFFSFWWSHQTREKPIRAGGGGGQPPVGRREPEERGW